MLHKGSSMIKNPVFTVIIPVFNAEIFLKDCLDSVLSQSHSNFQIIAVDDGSTDNSRTILDEYALNDRRLKVIHKKNQGPLLARVDAIKIAESDYCVFIDSDDLLVPGFFEILIEEIAIQDHDVFIYNYERIATDGTRLKIAESIFENGHLITRSNKINLYIAIVEAKLNSLCIKAIKTELLKKDPTPYTQFSNIFFGEDLLLTLYPLTKAESIKYLDMPLYKYRMSEGSICRTFNILKLDSILIVYKEMYKYFPLWSEAPDFFYHRYLKTYGTTIISFFVASILQGSSFKATNQFLKSLSVSDKRFIEFLNNISLINKGLSNSQRILGILMKYKLYYLVYSYYRMRRLITFLLGKPK